MHRAGSRLFHARTPMPSLTEIVDLVRRGSAVESAELAAYQQSHNGAERFLAHQAGATLAMRDGFDRLGDALDAIDYGDRRVLEEFVGLCAFLNREGEATAPTLKFAGSAIRRGELALGLEAASSAAAIDIGRSGAWSRGNAAREELSRLFRRAADAAPFTPKASNWSNGPSRIGYVVSSLGDDEPAARAAASLAGHLGDADGQSSFRLTAYSTEAFCRRDGQQWAGRRPVGGALVGQPEHGSRSTTHSWINGGFGAVPSADRHADTGSTLKAAGAGQWIAPLSGDVVTAAVALAEQLVADQVDALVIDAAVADPIACLVAAWGVAKKTIWIGRRSAFLDDSVDAVIYYDPAVAEADRAFWTGVGIEAIVATEGVDLQAAATDAARREQYGIPAAATICATAAPDLGEAVSGKMIESAIELLRREPTAVYLLVGGGDVADIRRRFDAAGVGRRVGYAGRRRDLAGFLQMADLYLSPFPTGGDADDGGTLAAMGAGIAVLALADADGKCGPAGTEATADDLADWSDRASRLARDASARRRIGQSLRRRVEKQYSFADTAGRIRSLLGFLLKGDAAVKQAA